MVDLKWPVPKVCENSISKKEFDRKCQVCQMYGKMVNKIIGKMKWKLYIYFSEVSEKI